jgi:DNA-binding transcriptional ArsR family regulator
MMRTPAEPTERIAIFEELFSSRVRAAVLCRVLPRPHLGFSLTELSRHLGLPISSLQHECYKLERLGVLSGRREGNAYRYRGNAESPLNGPLTALVVVAIGEESALRATLDDVPGVHAAFLAGRVPKAIADGPAPLVVIGDVPLEELDALESRPASVLNLPSSAIELAYYRPDDWRVKLQRANPYVVSILKGDRLNLVSNDGLVPTISS